MKTLQQRAIDMAGKIRAELAAPMAAFLPTESRKGLREAADLLEELAKRTGAGE